MARRGRTVIYRHFAIDGTDDQLDPTWALSDMSVKAVRQNRGASGEVIKTEQGEERYIDANFYILNDVALSYGRTLHAPEVIDGDDRFEVVALDRRSGKGMQRLACVMLR